MYTDCNCGQETKIYIQRNVDIKSFYRKRMNLVKDYIFVVFINANKTTVIAVYRRQDNEKHFGGSLRKKKGRLFTNHATH